MASPTDPGSTTSARPPDGDAAPPGHAERSVPAPRPLPPAPPIERLRRSLAGRGGRQGDQVDLPLLRRLGVRQADPRGVADEGDGLGLQVGRAAPRLRGLLAALGAISLAAVAWWLLRPPAVPVEVSMPAAGAGRGTGSAETGSPGVERPAAETEVPSGVAAEAPSQPATAGAGGSAAPQVPLVVHASGAVARPGVYELPPGSRVDHLVRAAGGLAPDADPDRVNLAAPVSDGERVWVPRRGEAEVPQVVAGSAGGPTAGERGGARQPTPGAGEARSGPAVLIDLNRATADELETLPGVGPATAAAILAHRDQHGPFSSVEELLDVRGIGEAKLEQIRPLVTT
jgi:competence protein ComEA